VRHPWFAYAIWGVIGIAFMRMWVAYGEGLAKSMKAFFRPRRVAAFAAAKGWSYQDRGFHQLRPGPPYSSEIASASCTHMISGTSRGEPFIAYEYANHAQVVALKLPRSLPLVDVRPHDQADLMQLTMPSVTLESEAFGRRFSVRADNPKFASDVLHQRLMQALLVAPPLCWRIWEDDLVGWWPGAMIPTRIELYLAVLHTIKDEIPGFVWHDYGLTDTSAG
jgi:hypothetical protein